VEGEAVEYRHTLLHDAMASGDEDLAITVLRLIKRAHSVCVLHGLAEDDDDGDNSSALPLPPSVIHYAVFFGFSRLLAALCACDGVLAPRMAAALPFPLVDAYLWTPLQLAAHCPRGGDCAAVLLEHIQPDMTRVLLPFEAAVAARDMAVALSLAIRAGADGAALALYRRLLLTTSNITLFEAAEAVLPSLFGAGALMDVEKESLMATRTPESSYSTLLLVAVRAGLESFLTAVLQRAQDLHAALAVPPMREGGRYQIKAFLAVLVEEAAGRGHAGTVTLLLRYAQEQQGLELDLAGLQEPSAMAPSTRRALKVTTIKVTTMLGEEDNAEANLLSPPALRELVEGSGAGASASASDEGSAVEVRQHVGARDDISSGDIERKSAAAGKVVVLRVGGRPVVIRQARPAPATASSPS
jgi:hypothetical protein